MKVMRLVTVHPKIVEAYGQFGVFNAAATKGIADIRAVALRDFAVDRHGSVDDHPYGGGDGMVLRPEPLADAVDTIRKDYPNAKVLLTSPSGKPWTHAEAAKFAADATPLIVIAGRFGGVDQRFIDLYVDAEYSVGDVVLAGGELPAMMMFESILRLVPGVLGHAESAALDSFSPALGGGLEHPLYTRPANFRGHAVPPVLLSGDHEATRRWRDEQALARTRRLRPDLLPSKLRE